MAQKRVTAASGWSPRPNGDAPSSDARAAGLDGCGSSNPMTLHLSPAKVRPPPSFERCLPDLTHFEGIDRILTRTASSDLARYLRISPMAATTLKGVEWVDIFEDVVDTFEDVVDTFEDVVAHYPK